MAVYSIRKMGDPVLRMKADEVTEINDEIRALIRDMFETMYDAPGVGLAAPQVGISKRVIVVDVDDNPIALVNPELMEGVGSETDDEGCLSVPNERAEVERFASVRVQGRNEAGETVEIAAEGFLARALQHEIDHLEGILFVDKKIK